MGKFIVFAEITNVTVPAKELNWNGREMLSNCREDKVVFKSRGIAKGCVPYDDDEVNIFCLVTKDILKPWFID